MSREPKRKALIIGISDYTDPRLEELEFCKNDGEEMYEILESLGYESNKLLGEVKEEKAKDAIYDFFSDKNQADVTLLFYYSGHGVSDFDGNTYLASSDIDPDEPGRRGFSFEILSKRMEREKCIATKVVVILDCCYSGAAKLSSKGVRTTKGDEDYASRRGRIAIDETFRNISQGEGTYILSSSLSAQESFNLKTSNHSFYTNYLLQGLRGNTESVDSEGNVTARSLGNYLHTTITSLPLDEKPKQTPTTKSAGTGNVIIAEYPELKPLKKEDILTYMLKLLREAKVEEFNKMREQRSAIHLPFLDFSMERLDRAHIAGANLSSAFLNKANLSEADLEGANLSDGNLTRANLSNTDLTRVNLRGTNLTNANLARVDLRGTNAIDTNLSGVDLTGSIFEENSQWALHLINQVRKQTSRESNKSRGAPIAEDSRPPVPGTRTNFSFPS